MVNRSSVARSIHTPRTLRRKSCNDSRQESNTYCFTCQRLYCAFDYRSHNLDCERNCSDVLRFIPIDNSGVYNIRIAYSILVHHLDSNCIFNNMGGGCAKKKKTPARVRRS